MMNERQIKKMVGKMSQLFSMTSATMPRRFNMIKLTKTKLLASLILAILFSITCADMGTANNPTSPPTPIAPPAISMMDQTFIYKTQVAQIFPNSGGAIESYKLISGTLPDGLELDITDGQLVLSGTPTEVTSNTAKTLITAVPLEIEATNKSGSSRVSMNVTINPIFVSGDKSMGVVHDDITPDSTGMHTHSCGGCTTVTHPSHDANNNDPTLIHTANDISFASGGTGSATDPVLIWVASGATSLSFVVDFDGVTIPNFDATNNNAFSIQLLGIPVGATITTVTFEYMKALNQNNVIDIYFEPNYISKVNPISWLVGDNIGQAPIVSNENAVSIEPLLIGVQQRTSRPLVSPLVSTLESRIRITISITPPA